MTSTDPDQENSRRYRVVSWLFLIGSLVFTFDSLLEISEGISLHAVCHLFASVLFTVGSVLFIPKAQTK